MKAIALIRAAKPDIPHALDGGDLRLRCNRRAGENRMSEGVPLKDFVFSNGIGVIGTCDDLLE